MAATLMSPRMVSTADGCSGAAPYGAGWMSLELKSDSSLPVDGLLIFDGWLSDGATDADAISSVTVTVKDGADAEVPGSLLLVQKRLMWRSTSLLEANATYSVSWEVDPGWSFGKPPGGRTTFTTSGASSDFAEAAIDKLELTREPFLVGDTTKCTGGSFSSCGPYTWTFGTTELHAYGIRFDLTIPTSAPTYQQLTLDLRDDNEATQKLCVAHSELPATGEGVLKAAVAKCGSPPEGRKWLSLWCMSHPGGSLCGTLGDLTPSPEPESDSGCACSVPGPTPGGGSDYALLALGAALALKRRRHKN